MSSKRAEEEHLPTHVAACEQRYEGINARLNRIERIGGKAILLLIVQLLGVIGGLGMTILSMVT